MCEPFNWIAKVTETPKINDAWGGSFKLRLKHQQCFAHQWAVSPFTRKG